MRTAASGRQSIHTSNFVKWYSLFQCIALVCSAVHLVRELGIESLHIFEAALGIPCFKIGITSQKRYYLWGRSLTFCR